MIPISLLLLSVHVFLSLFFPLHVMMTFVTIHSPAIFPFRRTQDYQLSAILVFLSFFVTMNAFCFRPLFNCLISLYVFSVLSFHLPYLYLHRSLIHLCCTRSKAKIYINTSGIFTLGDSNPLISGITGRQHYWTSDHTIYTHSKDFPTRLILAPYTLRMYTTRVKIAKSDRRFPWSIKWYEQTDLNTMAGVGGKNIETLFRQSVPALFGFIQTHMHVYTITPTHVLTDMSPTRT